MFADAALAARIDRAEADLVADITRTVQQRRPEARALITPIGGGLAACAGPDSPSSKVIGIGFDGPLDAAALDAMERDWRDRQANVRVELSILADASVPPMLSQRGYGVHGFENALARRLDDIGPAWSDPELTVEVLREEDVKVWTDITITAFSNLDGTGSMADDPLPSAALEDLFADILATPGYTRYLARVGGRPAGTASLRLRDGLAQVAGSGTLPAFRGRGVQKALLHRRLVDARAAGCDLAVVTTSPGTRSQENMMKRGFVLLYTRIILVKPWA